MLIPIILLQILIFAGLVFFLRQILTKDVGQATQHLKQQEEETAKKEQELKAKLQDTEKYYEETLKKANDESGLIKTQAIKEIHEARERILEQARTQSEEIIQRANKTSEQLRENVLTDLGKKTLLAASELLRNALPPAFRRKIHDDWVEELLTSELAALDRMHLPEGLGSVELKTAFPLTPQEKGALKSKLKARLKKDLEIHEVTDSTLVAGVVVTLGGVVLDGSLANKIRDVAEKHAGG
ncbi:MAG: F0F1 ATP synthase subunit delta [Candidatus Omnitrophica bacterium]|nr:F0F1 ATP synthase subunit delta [Candidatus Omnitrophota bacterium]